MRAVQLDLVALHEVPALDQRTVVGWHRAHLNPALVDLMALGGYDKVRIERAQGAYLHTRDGRRLLDLVSSYGALNHGHNHPRVVQAARWFDQQNTADLLKEFPSPYAAALAHNLAAVAPGDLDSVFLCNSGTEALEGALKLAMRVANRGRDLFVYARNSLHGKTLGALSVTGRDKYRAGVRLFEDWQDVAFGDIEALQHVFEAVDGARIAGLVLEPIQGEGGVVVPPAGYLAGAAQLCRDHGALLILDEVQTGLGRTGTLFRCEAEGVVPDILCLAKSLGGGVASLGATLTRSELQRRSYGTLDDSLVHTSTFGGRSRAAAVGIEALAVTLEEGFAEQAARRGAWLKSRLEEVAARHPEAVRSVRGEGLMLGLELQPLSPGVWKTSLGLTGLGRILDAFLPGILGSELLRRHDILASFVLNHPRVLRIYPALVATREDLAAVPEALDAVFARGLAGLVAEHVRRAAGRVGLDALRRWAGRLRS